MNNHNFNIPAMPLRRQSRCLPFSANTRKSSKLSIDTSGFLEDEEGIPPGMSARYVKHVLPYLASKTKYSYSDSRKLHNENARDMQNKEMEYYGGCRSKRAFLRNKTRIRYRRHRYRR